MFKHISFYSFLITLFLIFSISFSANANHILGGDLTYTCIGSSSYNLQLALHRDCNGITLGSTVSIEIFSPTCGTQTQTLTLLPGFPQDVTETCLSSQSACNGGTGSYGVQLYIYKSNITFTGCWATASDIRISWEACCRSQSIGNINAPGSSNFYLYNQIDNTLNSCNNSVNCINRRANFFCVNEPVHLNIDGFDFDNDSLVYSLTSCLDDYNSPISYNAPYTGTAPLSTTSGITINPNTGALDFIPNIAQTATVCIQVEEYRSGIKINETIREMYLTILPCGNSQPILSGINGIADSTGTTGSYSMTVCPNTPISFTIASYDKNVNDVILSSAPQNLVILSSSSTFSVDTNALPNVYFQWTPTQADVGQNVFSLTILDDNCPYLSFNTYSYTIHVLENSAIDAGGVVSTCVIGDTVALNAAFVQSTSQTATFTWTPTYNLSGTSSQIISAFPDSTTTYHVDVQYGNGCSSSDSVTVYVTDGLDIPDLPDTSFCSANPFVLDANLQSLPPTTSLNDSLKAIIDNDPAGQYSYLNVTGIAIPFISSQTIESVCINMSHDFSFGASDLDIYLVSPNEVVMELSTDNGTTNSAPYTNTCFTPTAIQNIGFATPPFTGNYQPEGSFSTLIGEPTNGLWKLWVIDDAPGFTHKIVDWSITFRNSPLVNYTWSPASSLSCTNCSNPVATPTANTAYWVHATNEFGCSDSAQVVVLVEDTIPAPTITSVTYNASTMDICWAGHLIADGYEINIDNTGWIGASGDTCHSITGLTSGQIVDIQIRGLTNCSSTTVFTYQQAITFGSSCLDHGGYLTTMVDNSVIQNNLVNVVNFGSTLSLSHSGGNLSSDGNPMTAPGFDIPIYMGSPPTITGSTAAAINADASFTGDFVGTSINGDAIIQNNGLYQNTLNSGNPVHLWFAPMTLDDHANKVITENAGSPNECAHVNTAEQINVVFLNDIDTLNFQNIVNGDSCTARIQMKGGLPEWDASIYTITVHQVGDPTITATINTPPIVHNGLLEFTVPEQGDYLIQVIDNNLKSQSFTVSMNHCPIICSIPFSSTMNITSDYNGVPVSCFDATDGSISVSLNGGTAPFTYTWAHDTTLNSSTANNLGAGTYLVQVSDAGGCIALDTMTIVPPLPLSGNTISIPDTNDWDVGMLIGNAFGGIPPYSYQWDNALLNVADDTVYNVPQGVYSVTITDANGCMLTELVTVDSIFNSTKELDYINLFQIAPNPTTGIATVQLELSTTATTQFDILDVQGQVLKVVNEEYTNQRQLQLDLSDYPAGVYIIRLRIDDVILSKKLLLMD